MIAHLISPLRRAAADTARRAVFCSVGGLMILVGLFFLTIAAWIFLAQLYGAMTAALVLGLVFLGIGLIVMAFGMRRKRHLQGRRHEKPAELDTAALINAFLGGLAAGNGVRKK